jgi:chromatin structure-remodeling complex subunit RSC1/2
LNRTGYTGTSSQSYTPQSAQQAIAQQQAYRQGAQAGNATGYKAPNPVEVWHLPDAANASIPAEIRSQFQTDAHGRVLFFTAPPQVDNQPKKKLTHSAAYLAFRARKSQSQAAKRGADDDATVGAEQANGESKRARTEDDVEMTDDSSKTAQANAIFTNITNYLADATIAQFKQIYGEERWGEAMTKHLQVIANIQAEKESLQPNQSARSDGKVLGLNNMLDYKPSNESLELLK